MKYLYLPPALTLLLASPAWTQAITYTAQNPFDELKPDFEELLNGLVINP